MWTAPPSLLNLVPRVLLRHSFEPARLGHSKEAIVREHWATFRNTGTYLHDCGSKYPAPKDHSEENKTKQL